MVSWDEVKKHLPQYLSAESLNDLYKELEAFPQEEYEKFYSEALLEKDSLFQGDGLSNMPIFNFPSNEILKVPVMFLSNTCDNDSTNERYIPPNIVYAPIVSLSKLVSMLKDNKVSSTKITSFINAIKEQKVTHLFYLPAYKGIKEESVVLLDRINNHINDMKPEEIKDLKLFCLGNFGFYLFLFKLSVHFTRIRESVDRDKGIIL